MHTRSWLCCRVCLYPVNHKRKQAAAELWWCASNVLTQRHSSPESITASKLWLCFPEWLLLRNCIIVFSRSRNMTAAVSFCVCVCVSQLLSRLWKSWLIHSLKLGMFCILVSCFSSFKVCLNHKRAARGCLAEVTVTLTLLMIHFS